MNKPQTVPESGRFFTLSDVTDRQQANAKGAIANYVSVHRDETHELQLQEQLRQSQKMEAVGQLAGGVAHDFNNLLTTIGGYARLIQRETSPVDPRYQDLAQISKTVDRAAVLVRQLLAFSRQEASQPVSLNLNSVITNLMKLLSRVIGEDVELVTDLAPDLARVQANPGQMEQILVNLAVNARDAMPKGGRLVLETKNVVLDERYADGYLELEPGEYVQMSASDTGIGMDDEVLSHIFEPFFTTKPKGKGTGLGLATVYGIVKQHRGHIHVYSESGYGSTFRVYLPVCQLRSNGRLAENGRHPAEEAPTRAGTETLLVVEDEELVRQLLQRVLENYGYTVLAGADAEQGVDLFQAHRHEISLLVSDVVLPGATGPALYQGLRTEMPQLKVLFLSGYPGEMIREHGLLSDAAFLAKPFTPGDLARTVRQVLDA